jgi:hypothetical protein
MRFLIVAGMLVLAVSASMTPANAAHSGNAYCGNYGIQGIYCHCIRQCNRENPWAMRHDLAMRSLSNRSVSERYVACTSTCVNAAEGARH